MITLNDYLYSGDTVLKILKKYTEDLRQSAVQTGNEVDVRHCEFLSQIMELLEHNDFLTAQSQKIGNFINIWRGNILICPLHSKGGSSL